MQCPYCLSRDVHPSCFRWFDTFLKVLLLEPYCCHACKKQFRQFGWKSAEEPNRDGGRSIMVFHCPHCRQRLEALDEQAGDVTDCRHCGKEIQIPTPTGASAEKTDLIVPKTKKNK